MTIEKKKHNLEIVKWKSGTLIIEGNELEFEWVDTHAIIIWTNASQRERLTKLAKIFISKKRPIEEAKP